MTETLFLAAVALAAIGVGLAVLSALTGPDEWPRPPKT